MIWLLWTTLLAAAPAENSTDGVKAALQEIQDIVGQWQGSGKSDSSPGWDEMLECRWKFNKNGRVSLYLTFVPGKKAEGRILDEAMITYDPERKVYILKAYRAAKDGSTIESRPADVLEFVGAKRTAQNLVLDRVAGKGDSKTSDQLDRLDIKLLNEGDRLVYTFQRRIGKSDRFRTFAQVGLNRVGTSLAGAAASGPRCIVTGGAGTMTVSYDGKTYFVCCTGCRDAFLADPKKFLAKGTP